MAARTTPDEVRDIITTTLEDPAIQVWIGVANTIVTANVTCGLGATVLEEIERQLTAHFISLLPSSSGGGNMSVKSEKLGEAQVTYSDVFAGQKGIGTTIYGQAALALDTCGGLKNLSKKAASIKSITSFE